MNYNYKKKDNSQVSSVVEDPQVPTTMSVFIDGDDISEEGVSGVTVRDEEDPLQNTYEYKLPSKAMDKVPAWIARMPKKQHKSLLDAYDVYTARSRGWSWEKIAAAADVTVGTVKKRWDRWVEFAPLAKSDDLLRQEDSRLDVLLEYWTPLALNGNIEATRMVLQLTTAKTKLHGLDAKSRVAIGGLQLEQQKAAMVAQALRLALKDARISNDVREDVIEGFVSNMKQLEG